MTKLPSGPAALRAVVDGFRLALLIALPVTLAACGETGPDGKGAAAGEQAGPAPAPGPAPVRTILPERFLGAWDASAAACRDRSGEMRLIVEPERLLFHESVAGVEAVRPAANGAADVELALEGEGESWRETRTLRLLPHGRLEVDAAGSRATRVRCEAAGDQAVPAGQVWDLTAGGDGVALRLTSGDGERALTLICPRASGELLVNVSGFRPVASEERMSFGSGGTVTALVADTAGDARRGGVTGRGPLPEEMEAILAGSEGIRVNYGAQDTGPHPAPPPAQARTFLTACRA